MKKTVYLNLNLDNPKDLALYNFLEDLGREKKAILYYLLDKQGCFSENADAPVAKISFEKKKQNTPVQRNVPVREEKTAEVLVESREELFHPEQKEVLEKRTEEIPVKEVATEVAGNYSESQSPQKTWASYFAPEQVEAIKSIPHVLEGIQTLTPYQQQVMAEELGTETDSYAIKSAFEESRFAHE